MKLIASVLAKFPGQARVYLLLALFNLLSSGAGVMLCQQLLNGIHTSVRTNAAWAERLDAFAGLAKTAGDADAPGNDVFKDHDIPTQRRREAEAKARFDADLVALRTEITAHLPPDSAQSLVASLEKASQALAVMHGHSQALFDALDRGDDRGAGEHMADMDQAFAEVTARLADARVVAAACQEKAFAEQERSALRTQLFQYLVAALMLLVILAATIYGVRIALRFERSQTDLSRKNRDMRLVFDNVAQGFLTIQPTGQLAPEHSRIVETWFGSPGDKVTFSQLIAPSDPNAATWFDVGLAEIEADLLPIELTLDQLPKRVKARDGRPLGLEVQPVYAGGRISQFLVVLSDLTQVEARAEAEEVQREAMAIFERVMKDREGFLEFFAEASALVERFAGAKASAVEDARILHTLKGNCGIYGQTSLANTCHALEDRMEESGGGPSDTDRAFLQAKWGAFAARVSEMLGSDQVHIGLADEEYEDILRLVVSGGSRQEIAERVRSWRNESAHVRLSRLASQAASLAERLGRCAVEVRVEARTARLPAGDWRGVFGTLVHVVRNAVDHGLETPEERAEAGKPPSGAMSFRTCAQVSPDGTDEFVLEISDDGRGIDWEAVKRKASALGIAAERHEELVAALFTDGLSTRDEVSELSGRGVGLGALKEQVELRGGHIEVESERGLGTKMRFVFPVERDPFVASVVRLTVQPPVTQVAQAAV